MSHSVIFKNVTKKYKMYKNNAQKLLDVVIPDGYGEDFYALQNISFTADEGDVIGIIGVNGAGKSTLSNLITGIIPPTSGSIEVKGQASLIAINTGLNNNLSGRENIELKCLMLGFNKKQIRELMPEIIEFADIGKFIDQPVKNYSSGMKSRLGFAISVNVDPDILVIDEALSVGDQTFTDKCLDKMNEFKERGKTIFFISHSIGQVKKFCQKALWLEAGEVKAYGTIEEIVPEYEKFLKEFKKMSKEEQKNFKQMVLEKRSRLREQEQKAANDEDELIPQGLLRESKKKHKVARYFIRLLYVIIFLILIGGGIIYATKSGLLSKQQNHKSSAAHHTVEHAKSKNTVTTEKTKKQKASTFRYVDVPKANIRKSPDGVAIATVNFGQALQIKTSKKNTDGVTWYRVSFDGNEGWISSKVLANIKDEKNDEQIAKQIDQLLGVTPSLKEAIPMIGKKKGAEQSFAYTTYKYKKGVVTGFTIKVTGSSPSEVAAQLGEPQLKSDDTLLYHGSKYDFIFVLSTNGTIDTLTVLKR
ncbi:teichoic acids export ABC transporter ATP-binding subunit TagH [Heyndrickxia ginsengihumi]|uniref:teichoic acids export ABC transporter ATP-binding subunit TagH n=1 Tax=Heyndrickxia ginsengihumi TaxID=363870 RepID=UPI00204226DF|nr:teichoic acids export ABC transporter ATP-binding subunit TagH [Heyndrickxia ginsengihumi]MCM3023717.1 teichoic acids export ABC transporter ATP-binding subunit TagH [Heyndrickxia ginsengihumi]